MDLLDLAHAYQAFQPPNFVPSLIEENLRKIFLPLSRAMREGLVRRGLQLQGWTIDAWLSAEDPIRELAIEVLDNLKEAAQSGNIEVGASAYSHPIVPLLDDQIIRRQVKEDLEAVREYLGEPTWFWFPEAAVGGRSLSILHELAPNLVAVIPDGAFQPEVCFQGASASGGDPPQVEGKERFSGFVRVGFEDGSSQRVIVGNTLLKDLFMNSEDYQVKPGYAPKGLDWETALRATHSGKAFRALLEGVYPEPVEGAVLMRDLENAGSKYGLAAVGNEGAGAVSKEVKGLMEVDKVRFLLPSQIDWEETSLVDISNVKASCWEPIAKPDDPYPYWAPVFPPKELKQVVSTWRQLVEAFNNAYRPDLPKESLLVVASDVPWHFLGREEWDRRPRDSTKFTKKVILPIVRKIGDSRLLEAANGLLKAISTRC
jgi:hypothetical protein